MIDKIFQNYTNTLFLLSLQQQDEEELESRFRPADCKNRLAMSLTSFVLCATISQYTRRSKMTTNNHKKRNHYRIETVADIICVISYFIAVTTAIGIAACRIYSFFSQRDNWPSPLGLSMGIGSVFIFQILLVAFHYARHRFPSESLTIRVDKPILNFRKELLAHLMRWEGFALLLPYLCLTWMLGLMPNSYYELDASNTCFPVFDFFDPTLLWMQLLSVDFFMYLAHITEHRLSWIYRKGHKQHHIHRNPRLFDAFSGHIFDTTLMILVPLYITANLVHANCGSYIVFGTSYSAYLMIIHSEYAMPWDALARSLGIGTAHDHNVHHTKVVYNFGHFFMIWDQLFGTYMDPRDVDKFRIYRGEHKKRKKEVFLKPDNPQQQKF